MKNTVLVTGGAGYIGSHVCVELLERDYTVVVLDSCQCMWSFSLTIGDGWSAGKWGLEHENNCFPYFCSAGGVYMFGYDHESTPVENARRVLLACAQSVGAEGEHKFISMMPGLETWPGS